MDYINLGNYQLEERVAFYYYKLGRKVKVDVGLAGIQIDILVKEKKACGTEITTIVKCKGYSRKVDVSVVKSMASSFHFLKQKRLADKAIIASISGFSKQSKIVAAEYGIELIKAKDLVVNLDYKQRKMISNKIKIRNNKAKRIFVAIPFSKEFHDVYILGIRDIADKLGAIVERVDEIEHNDEIIDMIRKQIDKSDIVIGDTSGANPNVMYEIGLSHGKNKPTILMCRKNKDEKLPFNISGTNHIIYETIVDLRCKLKNRLKSIES
ncbi:restriction endonuclease [Proteinivorax tanatarense]|uniref:Restriction endonuclease n=1 Tax=Proteinivorax tanatarense TaxID=1260629 RepID=A0AAU7VKE3_9FIRM